MRITYKKEKSIQKNRKALGPGNVEAEEVAWITHISNSGNISEGWPVDISKNWDGYMLLLLTQLTASFCLSSLKVE